MNEKLVRMLETLRCVPRAPKKIDTASVETILRGRGVDTQRRYVQRDLQELSRIFPLFCDEEHKPFGWSWAKDGAALELPSLDVHTALTLRLVREHLRQALPQATLAHLAPHFQRADEILKSSARAGFRTWSKRLRTLSRFQPLLPPTVNEQVVGPIYDALIEERALEARYRGRGDDAPKDVTLHPIGLVLRDGAIYLVCTYFEYADVRYLPLHRFLRAEVSTKRRRVPKGFDLDAYLARGEFGFLVGERPLKLVAIVDDVVAGTLEETALSDDQKLRDSNGGRWILNATVPDTKMLRGWILSYGTRVEVLRPARLRREIGKEVAQMAAKYAD